MTTVSINYSGYTLDELLTSTQSLNRMLEEGRINLTYYRIRKNRLDAAISRLCNGCK